MAHESTNSADFSITIEYEGFLTRFDIDEIIEALDSMILSMLSSEVAPRSTLHSRSWWSYRETQWPSQVSFVGIRSIVPGSLTLLVFIGGVVVSYVGHRFAKGVDHSLLGTELKHSGQLFGNLVGPLVEGFNRWAEQYVPYQKRLNGNVKRLSARVGYSERDDLSQ